MKGKQIFTGKFKDKRSIEKLKENCMIPIFFRVYAKVSPR
jgi:hypothetical protein